MVPFGVASLALLNLASTVKGWEMGTQSFSSLYSGGYLMSLGAHLWIHIPIIWQKKGFLQYPITHTLLLFITLKVLQDMESKYFTLGSKGTMNTDNFLKPIWLRRGWLTFLPDSKIHTLLHTSVFLLANYSLSMDLIFSHFFPLNLILTWAKLWG